MNPYDLEQLSLSLLLPGQSVLTSQISEWPLSQQNIFVAKVFALAKRPLKEKCVSPLCLCVHRLGRNQGRKKLDLDCNFWLSGLVFLVRIILFCQKQDPSDNFD